MYLENQNRKHYHTEVFYCLSSVSILTCSVMILVLRQYRSNNAHQWTGLGPADWGCECKKRGINVIISLSGLR